MNNASSITLSEKSVINNSKNYGKTEVLKKLITTRELANLLEVSMSIIEMFSKKLFNTIPAEGFTADQAEAIKFELNYPFGNHRVIEETADNWIAANL